MEQWTLLTNHAQVLICIGRDPHVRLREVAGFVGITERAAQRIVSELVNDGYVTRTRDGRRNRYTVHWELPLRHRVEQRAEVRTLLELLSQPGTQP